MDARERFVDEPVAQWFDDLSWAWDDNKTRQFLLHVFSGRAFSAVARKQARLWCRIIQLFWRDGLTKREIAERFGYDKENVKRILKAIRREAKKFFMGQKDTAPKKITAKQRSQPMTPDTANESQGYWDQVLASHGLFDPDSRTRGWKWSCPTYRFNWLVTVSVATVAWAEFYDSLQANQRLEYNGGTHFLAHLPTVYSEHALSDVERAIDGDREAGDFLRAYGAIHDERSAPVSAAFKSQPRKAEAKLREGPQHDLSDLRIVPMPPPLFLDAQASQQ